jgi:hypothetical protein
MLIVKKQDNKMFNKLSVYFSYSVKMKGVRDLNAVCVYHPHLLLNSWNIYETWYEYRGL